jgi:hypothetical protein
MTPGRKKRGVVFWAIVVVVGLVLYPLSYGPAMRFVYENGQRRRTSWDRDAIRQSLFLFYLPIRRSDRPGSRCGSTIRHSTLAAIARDTSHKHENAYDPRADCQAL